MKAVLMSIQPKWCELITNGKKTIEVRKTKPKLETPFKVYIYCTYGEGLIEANDEILPNHLIEQKVSKYKTWGNCCNGKVIGEFVCDDIDTIAVFNDLLYCEANSQANKLKQMCLTIEEIKAYLGKKNIGYGWHISNLVIYDEPHELSEFKKINRECWYADLGLAKRDCPECKNAECFISRPPQSWCYVEGGAE